MSLPIVILNRDEKWDCHQCGYCCRGSLIPLNDDDVQRLQNQKWDKRPDYRNIRIMVRDRGASSSYRLAHRSDGSCVFLSEDGRCRIHSEFGSEAKPTVCQVFPLQLVSHDKHAILTIRRACPSAAADLGNSMSIHLPFVKQLVRDKRLKSDPITPPLLKAGESREWKTLRIVLETLGGLLQDDRYPPVRRLAHALKFASHLETAKTKQLSDQQVADLAKTLAELAPEESKPLFEDRRAPKGYAKVMFRLLAMDCARLHPECRHQSKWSGRFQMAKTTLAAVRGSGTTPRVDAIFPVTQLEELEKPFGVKPAEIFQPLERFIETTSASFLYAIANRRTWSVVESIRALALLFPVGLWLLKWLSHGREPTAQDMLHIVVALDRSQGFAPLCGPLHRWRLYTLSAQSELERLVIWYAR